MFSNLEFLNYRFSQKFPAVEFPVESETCFLREKVQKKRRPTHSRASESSSLFTDDDIFKEKKRKVGSGPLDSNMSGCVRKQNSISIYNLKLNKWILLIYCFCFIARELQIVFIYDTLCVRKEEDDPKDAILYFHPDCIPEERRIAICGQLMGITHFLVDTFSAPKILTLDNGKFAMRKFGRQYILVRKRG